MRDSQNPMSQLDRNRPAAQLLCKQPRTSDMFSALYWSTHALKKLVKFRNQAQRKRSLCPLSGWLCQRRRFRNECQQTKLAILVQSTPSKNQPCLVAANNAECDTAWLLIGAQSFLTSQSASLSTLRPLLFTLYCTAVLRFVAEWRSATNSVLLSV
jgi:hypothetical protein